MIPDKREIKKFSLIMFIGFLILGLIFYFRNKPFYLIFWVVAAGVIFLRFIFLSALIPLYKIWMRLAHILSWINTRIMLIIIFFLVFTPISLILKIIRKDLLDIKIYHDKKTYWHKKEEKVFSNVDYEHQF